jgi:pyruvate dehydrogenase E1 component
MLEDQDPNETREWLDALDGVIRHGGADRARYLLEQVTKHAADSGVKLPTAITTPFRNTISPAEQKPMPGDLFMERRIRSLIRWNALAMVMRANDNDEGWAATFQQLFVLGDAVRRRLQLLFPRHRRRPPG